MIYRKRISCLSCSRTFTVRTQSPRAAVPTLCRDCIRKKHAAYFNFMHFNRLMSQYPATRGHRHQVHGGVFD